MNEPVNPPPLEEQPQPKNEEQQIKNSIDKYWEKNKNLFNSNNTEEKKITKTVPSKKDNKK